MATERDARADRIEKDVAAALPGGVEADCAIAAVMGAVTRRMSRGEARRVIGAMPARHRAFLSRLVDERGEEAERLGRPGVLAAIRSDLGGHVDAERVAHAVLGAVGRALPQGLLRDALGQLPPEVASLWRTEAEGPAAGPVTSYPRPLVAEGVARDTVLDHPVIRRLEEMRAVPEGFTGASVFSVVACELTRRLPRGEAQHLVDSLPEPLRPLLDPCMAARDEEPLQFGRDELMDRLAEQLDLDRPSAELVARAVIRCIKDELSAAAKRHVESQLPEDLAELWRLRQSGLTEVQREPKLRRVIEQIARLGTARPR